MYPSRYNIIYILDSKYHVVHTDVMVKKMISIPNDIDERIKAHRKQGRVNVSQICADALNDYFDKLTGVDDMEITIDPERIAKAKARIKAEAEVADEATVALARELAEEWVLDHASPEQLERLATYGFSRSMPSTYQDGVTQILSQDDWDLLKERAMEEEALSMLDSITWAKAFAVHAIKVSKLLG